MQALEILRDGELQKTQQTLNFSLLDQKWGSNQQNGTDGGIVTFSFANSNFPFQFQNFDRFMIEPEFREEIIHSLKEWENIANIHFLQIDDTVDADIRFGWANIDGEGKTVADATIPSFGPLDDVIVRFDFEENWLVGGNAIDDMIDFSVTALHEIGHAIGIGHSETFDSLMSESYSGSVFDLSEDDRLAAVEIYGTNNIGKVNVHRFFKGGTDGHFYTSNEIEAQTVGELLNFADEGIAFQVVSAQSTDVTNTIPIYRFFNTQVGSHFYTASEVERLIVAEDERFNFEGVVFRGFEAETISVDPIYRFFDAETGNHFYTGSDLEKEHLISKDVMQFEGVSFYAYQDFF